MTVAALALALALLVAPRPPRHRFVATRSPRWIRPAAVLAGAGVIAVLAPVGATLAGALVAATVMLRRTGSRHRARRAEESSALQSALTVLVGELRVGAHPVVAFESAAADVAGPVAIALRSVAARARLGADVAAGLRSVAMTSTVPGYWERLSASWLLAQTHGLAIVALVRAAQRDIVARERFASSVAAGMAGARATAAILAGLPFLGVALGQLIGARPLRYLLSGGTGGWLLVIGVTLACAGLWWSDRITDRVLG
ncbi:type II secretion system F family protein [Mycobacterium antarcticum]|uniref:type II secretion system F family protein n=1 Tax=unclassified Mycolicibacterium TaxID=2636767 RepID=UPI0024E15FFD|nr:MULTISPECIES: type II secretion system F family protein [unclassified Mycolicibacterium]